MPTNGTERNEATALLLAAGASRRFGAANKLLALFRGNMPLIGHAARAVRGVPVARRIAVITDPEIAPFLDGFETVQVPQGQQSDSLRAGLEMAGRPQRLLIVLGDMPLVTPGLLSAVLAACDSDSASASCDVDGTPMPPACFPHSWLPRLAALTGDQGAGRLIRDLPKTQLVRAEGQLSDIDTVEELRRLQN